MAKRANLQRVKEFARNLNKFNDSYIKTQTSKLPPPNQVHEIQKATEKISSKRTKALEFARHIPKPNVNSKETEEDYVENNGQCDKLDDKDVYGLTSSEANRISELETKHLEKKKQIEAIKKSMGMK